MSSQTPDHFDSRGEFSAFILRCAIRDRESFLEAVRHTGHADIITETELELNAMHERLESLEKRSKPASKEPKVSRKGSTIQFGPRRGR